MKKIFFILIIMLIFPLPQVSAFNFKVDVNDVIEQRENNFTANESIQLFSGDWIVGEDINSGRYEITSGSFGNFVVSNKNDIPIVNEVLGDTGFGLGVESITIDLEDGQKISISGMDDVLFSPSQTVVKENELTTGTWIVGTDIKPGKYIATTTSGSGNIIVTANGLPVVNEILTSDKETSMGLGVEKIQLNLKEDQIVFISMLNNVLLELQ